MFHMLLSRSIDFVWHTNTIRFLENMMYHDEMFVFMFLIRPQPTDVISFPLPSATRAHDVPHLRSATHGGPCASHRGWRLLALTFGLLWILETWRAGFALSIANDCDSCWLGLGACSFAIR